jgi:hypothetical protein
MGTRIVAHYRLYFLDQADHIRHAISLECDDDSQALAVVDEHRDGRTIELWEGVRRVARLEAE